MIKMRVNKSKQSVCDECGTEFMDTLEMYDIMFVSEMYTVCYDCANTLFHKLLKADCLYNGKLKDKDDQISGYKYVNLGKMMDNIKAGIEPMEAIEKASGKYGRFDEAVKKIDPRKE